MDELLCEFPQLRIIDEVWLAITPGWEPEDVLFFCELTPELGGRRLMNAWNFDFHTRDKSPRDGGIASPGRARRV